MCGVIFAESFTGNPVNELIAKQYEAQKHRGTQGFGFFDRSRTRLKRATKERKILGQLKNSPSDSIMFHHRFPTSTENVKNACHPFSTKDHFKSNYVLVHNGVIRNADKLKPEHEKLGITYASKQWEKGKETGKFNDSEALLWDVALYLEGKQEKLKAYGSIAFICLEIPNDKRKASKLHFGRNNNPLKMVFDDTMIMLSSEGEGKETKPHNLYTYNYKTKKLDNKHLSVPSWDPEYVAPKSYNFGSASTNNYTPGSYASRALQKSIDDAEARLYVPDPADDYESYDSYEAWEKRNKTTASLSHFDDEYDMVILPESEDYSYSGIMGKDVQDFVFERNDGVLTNVKATIADRLDAYLEFADGNYKTAFTLLKYDIGKYQKQLSQDKNRELVEDEDLVLELDLLTASKIALFTSPWWATDESIDPGYKEMVKYVQDTEEAVSKAALEEQQKLLTV